MLMCIRVNIVCDQIVSKGGLRKATSFLARTQLAGQTVVTAWNGSLSPQLKGWPGKCLLWKRWVVIRSTHRIVEQVGGHVGGG